MSDIDVVKLHKTYNNKAENPVNALNGLCLNIKDGEFISIEGTSGSGKSTLLHLLAGLDRATSGSIRVKGIDITGFGNAELAVYRNKSIGIVLQDFFLIEYRTVADNVILPLIFNRSGIGKAYDKAEEVLNLLNIGELAHRKVNCLSGGQKQRVAIARAIINDPDILLADEPTGALDSRTTAEIMQILRDMNSSGKTVVVVTHDPMVSDYADRIIKIEDGVAI